LSGPGNDLLDTPLAGPAAIRGGALRVSDLVTKIPPEAHV
jgi:hypothetical protein